MDETKYSRNTEKNTFADIEIVKSFKEAICIFPTGTRASQFTTHKITEIECGQHVFDFMLLKTGAVVFKLTHDADPYYVSSFGIMFAVANEETHKMVVETIKMTKSINRLLDKRNKHFTKFQPFLCDTTKIEI